MPDPLTAAELAVLASIVDAAARINGHIAELRALAQGVRAAVPSAALPAGELGQQTRIGPVPHYTTVGAMPMQQGVKPAALDLARYAVPPGVELKPDGG